MFGCNMMTDQWTDVSEWFNGRITMGEFTVEYEYTTHSTGHCSIFSCDAIVKDKNGIVTHNKSDKFSTKKEAVKHARYLYYSKLSTPTSSAVVFDGPGNSSSTNDLLIPCNGERCFNIIDVESVPKPYKLVQFSGIMMYFCRQQSKSALPIIAYDEVDCLSSFELQSESNVCVVGANMCEVVDHYISACTVHILYYCKKNDIKYITISSNDLSAKCTVYIMEQLISRYKMNIQVCLLGRSVYLKDTSQ